MDQVASICRPRDGRAQAATMFRANSVLPRAVRRCEEGIVRAKAKGVTFGRNRKLDKEMVRVAA